MNYLLSYPRSGNTWLRYCIETLSGIRTIGYLNSDLKDKGVLEKYRNDQNVILIKRHETKEITKNDKLILIIRDYNEVLIRHKGVSHNIIKESGNTSPVNYLSLIEFYESFSGDKILIFYEDLITDTRSNIERVLSFLEITVTDETISSFFENIELHKTKSIDLYGESKTKGRVDVRHSSILSKDKKDKNKNFLKEKYSDLYSKYLNRYGG